MSIGKTLRFEIFARDGFTCQYCGRRPPDVVLELDHIHPKSKEGPDDPINLITACFDCNRGKRDKVIAEIPARPDADLAYLKVQQEIAEVQRFIEAQKKLEELNEKLIESLQDVWSQFLTKETVPTRVVLLPWIKSYGAEEIVESIKLAAMPYLRGQFEKYGSDPFFKLIKYVGAILRNRRDRGEAHQQQPEEVGVEANGCN